MGISTYSRNALVERMSKARGFASLPEAAFITGNDSGYFTTFNNSDCAICGRLQEISRRPTDPAISAGFAPFSTGDANPARVGATQRDIDERHFHQGKVAVIQWIQHHNNREEIEKRTKRTFPFLCRHKKEWENVG